MSSNVSQKEMLEMMQKLVNPFGFPLQSLLMPTFTIEEVEKKISELRTVEVWLTTNLSMLQLTIKTLEYQKTLLAAGQRGVEPGPKENPFANMWPWDLMRQFTAISQSPEPKPEAGDQSGKRLPGKG